MSECRLPSIGPVINAVYKAIKEWFPRSNDDAREQLAFAITYDDLQVVHVEGEIWMAYIGDGSNDPQPTDAAVVDRIYVTIREWFSHFPAPTCRELARYIADDVLRVNHLAGEIWTLHVPASIPAEGEQDR